MIRVVVFPWAHDAFTLVSRSRLQAFISGRDICEIDAPLWEICQSVAWELLLCAYNVVSNG